MTGSTTSSNALFSALQREVAGLIHVPPAALVAAQTAGGNVGNSVAPVVVLVGTGALGGEVEVSEVVRRVLPAAAGLMVVVAIGTQVLIRW